MTAIELLRKRIGDNVKTEVEHFINIDTTELQTMFKNITVLSIFVDGTLLESSEYTVNSEEGRITLDTSASSESTYIVSYKYYAFSDTELTYLIADYGANEAVKEALRWLLADAYRLHDYSRGATNQNLSQVFKNVKELLETYSKNGDSIPDGTTTPTGLTVHKRIADEYRKKGSVVSDLSREDL